MGTTIDLTGKRFGRLLVMEKTDQRELGAVLWRCKCDCGNEKLVKTSGLTSGCVASCGCLRREMFGKGRITQQNNLQPQKYLPGCLFGDLKVLRCVKDRTWECRCIRCGEVVSRKDRELINLKKVYCKNW